MFIVERDDGRYEIRESHATERGPRATTLATFTTLDDQVLAKARVRATRPVDMRALVDAAEAKGVPVDLGGRADQLARELLGELRRGSSLSESLTALLRAALASVDLDDVPDTVGPMADWVDAAPAERAEALEGLLGLAEAVGHRPSGDLAYPRLEVT